MAFKTLAMCCLFALLPAFRGEGEASKGPYQQAVIIGQNDQRIAVVPGSRNALLTSPEVRQAMVSMGLIKCPGTDLHNGAVGTAAVVVGADVVVTAGHIFRDDNFRLRSPIKECFFINSKNPTHHYHIILEKDNYDHEDRRMDYAIARLDSSVGSAVPYKIDNSGDRPTDEPLIVITNNIDNKRFNAQPRVQPCHVRRSIEADEFGHEAFTTDCATYGGDSGAPVFTRPSSGELRLRGLITGQALGIAEHCVYNDTACSGRVVGIGRAFLSDLANFTHHQER